MKLDGIIAFVATAELGSITEASRRLGVSKSVVSERLADLERVLGARLLQRTTRRTSLTEDGRVFLERARRIARDVESATSELAERRGTLCGPMRLSAPVSFGALHLGPALYPFLRAHPEIELALDLDDRFVDAESQGYDAVVRHGPIVDSWLVAARIAPSRRLLVASPDYLASHGTPADLDDLVRHRGILYTNRAADWRFGPGPDGRIIQPRVALRVNNGMLMRDAARAGLGLTVLPSFLVHADLHSGALQAVDVGAEAESAEIFVAYPAGQGASAKLRALIVHLRESFGSPPYWDRDLGVHVRSPRADVSRRVSANAPAGD
jgi:DNA-binding transcriptional LysR family regulator